MRLSQTPYNFIEKAKDAVDSFIEIFNPKAAFLRRHARYASKMFSAYSGATKNRLKSSWMPGGGSADADLLNDLPVLRERSRDIIRNDGYANGISKTYASNIISSGIKAQSRLKYKRLGITKEQAVEYQENFEQIFENWIPNADAAKKLDFYEIQNLCIKQIVDNGDVVVLPLRSNVPGRANISLQIIEADRLTNPNMMPDNLDMREGVEIDEFGGAVAYHIKKTHPGDMVYSGGFKNEYVRYPAYDSFGNKNILHLYIMDRPGQSRGIPILAPVLSLFKDLSSYVEAELLKNRIAACFAIFVKKNDALAGAIGRSSETASNQRLESIEPGRIDYLAPGESIESATPQNTNGSFEPFVVLILRSIAAAINLPYEIVAKDFSKTNYSSARAALLDAVKYFKSLQTWISKKLCQEIYNMVIEDAYLRGEINIPNFYQLKSEWLRVKWQAPGWAWIDPLKEVQASELGLKTQIMSLSDIASSLGHDWEETLEQIAVEKQKKIDLDILPIETNQAGNALPGQSSEPQPQPNTGNE